MSDVPRGSRRERKIRIVFSIYYYYIDILIVDVVGLTRVFWCKRRAQGFYYKILVVVVGPHLVLHDIVLTSDKTIPGQLITGHVGSHLLPSIYHRQPLHTPQTQPTPYHRPLSLLVIAMLGHYVTLRNKINHIVIIIISQNCLPNVEPTLSSWPGWSPRSLCLSPPLSCIIFYFAKTQHIFWS